MNKQKGFTLAELLGALLFLAFMAIIVLVIIKLI